MAATTGTALWPSTTTYPNTNVYPGQGTAPIIRCRMSLDAASATSGTFGTVWTELEPTRLRSFSVSRGRTQDYGEIDAGTCTVVLDNRDRDFDPTTNANLRPLNRIWLFSEFSGVVEDIFVGWVQSYNMTWPSGGWSDAEVTIEAADEFMVLALEQLPTTSPPRSSYAALVSFDQPADYFDFGNYAETTEQPPAWEFVPPEDPPAGGSFEQVKGVRERMRRRWPH